MAGIEDQENMLRPEFSDTARHLRLIADSRRGNADAKAEYDDIINELTVPEWLNELKNMYDWFPKIVVKYFTDDGVTEKEIRKVIGYDQESN